MIAPSLPHAEALSDKVEEYISTNNFSVSKSL